MTQLAGSVGIENVVGVQVDCIQSPGGVMRSNVGVARKLNVLIGGVEAEPASPLPRMFQDPYSCEWQADVVCVVRLGWSGRAGGVVRMGRHRTDCAVVSGGVSSGLGPSESDAVTGCLKGACSRFQDAIHASKVSDLVVS